MPIALLGMLASCKICKIVLAAVVLTAVFFGFIKYEQHKGAAALVAQEAKLTAAESERRQKVIADARAQADKAVADNAALQRRNAGLTARIATLSRANDSRACLDALSVRRLNEFRQPASRGTPGG
jgi:hypothetical protein